MKQLSFFPKDEPLDIQDWGTFKDSLRAPIHNWFTYPAGFSYKAVESSLKKWGIEEGQRVYDPFMGSGTTNLVAKQLAISSYGVEAHPFVFRICRTKLNWEVSQEQIRQGLIEVQFLVKSQKAGFDQNPTSFLENTFPGLVLKCYEENTLLDLYFIREAIRQGNFPADIEDLFFVSLTSILRQVSAVATGWPYIAPKKQKTSSQNKNALNEFARQITKMISDIGDVMGGANQNYANSVHRIFNADSRNTNLLIPDSCIDHVFTSPPYLNNFDYADRTRLELYFWGEAKTWADISRDIRTRLITSATTQIARDDSRYQLSDEIERASPEVASFLQNSVNELSKLRLTKGGKKSYDHLVSGYFNDMFLVLSEVFRVLKNKSTAVFVLGDSAPYGVHIPTDDLIGKLGLATGFSDYSIQVLRERGGKWKDNPQRHNVSLRESIVTLVKE
ncbi:MAG: hypothetical protein HYZ26_01130 [Chloroflexi bacterium]|nr:hypothetical protein [Chloroflexota bacterium]